MNRMQPKTFFRMFQTECGILMLYRGRTEIILLVDILATSLDRMIRLQESKLR